MSLKKLYKDIFEKVNYIDENMQNPFISEKDNSNPFASFFGGTYVWVEIEEEPK